MLPFSTYQEGIRFLYHKLPRFFKAGKLQAPESICLENIQSLCQRYGEPQKSFSSIHVAGTNGKSSVCHLLASVLQQASYKVGLYTSPHLIHLHERIRVNGVPISQHRVLHFINELASANVFSTVPLSFFEVNVWMAFRYFQEQQVDYAVIEAGMGGRLDATNVVHPVLSVITSIDYDHQQFLGDSLNAIATEKAGIIKSKTPVVVSTKDVAYARPIDEKAKEECAPLYWASEQINLTVQRREIDACTYLLERYSLCPAWEGVALRLPFAACYQSTNLCTVISAITVLNQEEKTGVSLETLKLGVERVKEHTRLRGRWECVRRYPLIFVDGAHNQQAMEQVSLQASQLSKQLRKPLVFVVGMMQDKSIEACLANFPSEANYVFCQASTERSLSASLLRQVAEEQGLIGTSFLSVNEAIEEAMQNYSEALIIITGSIAVAGDAIAFMEGK